MFPDTRPALDQPILTGTASFQIFLTAGSETTPDWTPTKLDVFYLPIRLMDENLGDGHGEMSVLKGLLLMPNDKKHGEYRRIGMFEVADVWKGNCVQTMRCNRTEIYSPKYFLSKRGTNYTIAVV